MRIGITGSSGFIGRSLSSELEQSGHEVTRVVRGDKSDASSMWQPSQNWFREGALSGLDGIVHMTGVSIGAARWTEERKKLLWQSRVDATRLLVDHLATLSERPRVLVSASAVGFYGDGGEAELSEAAPRGEGFLAELCEAWEREARRAEDLGVRTVLARSGILLSSPDFLPRVARPFKLGLGARLGNGRQWMPWVTLEDELRALIFLLTREDTSGPFNLVAPPVRNLDFTRALGRAVSRPVVLTLPAFVLRLQFGKALADEALLASQRAVAGRLSAAGFEFRTTDMGTGLEEALQ